MVDKRDVATARRKPEPEPDYDHGAGDPELVARAKRDPTGFEPLYLRYADRLYRYALARTGSAAVADDIVAETMIAALESLDRFDATRGNFGAWLFTIARNRIADHGRLHRRMWRAIAQRWSPAPPEEGMLELTIQREEAAQVRAALDRLPRADREVVQLRYGAGLSSTEIGEVLGVSPGAVRTRLSRALKRLAVEIGDIDA